MLWYIFVSLCENCFHSLSLLPQEYTLKLSMWRGILNIGWISLGSCASVFIVKSLSCVWLFVAWIAACQAYYLAEFAQTHVHWISRAIQTPYPLLPSSSPALNIFQHQGLFQWVSLHIRCLKYWSFSFSISLSNKYSALISFRTDWFELLATQGTLKNLFQHHSSKASILRCSTFFSVQLSHLYMTTGKTIALTIQPFSVKWCLWF